ncbi:ThuA domain-containing protein [Rhodohalobacter sp. SW132]|uniref:ThuA domain-containing protein n=1 Tax=Rhodohalobacter sp. SW132 TaxID=2293433 RepID=UPI000E2416D6|nr:ThuA domain-containing protein [Rhodohalobacter sp. SW132]REL38158.1 ThuA domain-containing protein [Rhodohalobacter sp. SW132]
MNFRLIALLSIFFSSLLLLSSCGDNADQQQASADSVIDHPDQHILVFSKTDGWRHESIETGQEAIRQLGMEHNVGVTVTELADMFNPDTLSRFDVVVFLNTTETVFEDEHREAFKEYIQNGGGYVGVHSASDTEYDWPWYGDLVGAYFDNHPPGIINADIQVEDHNHPSTRMLPTTWNRDDEWYNFQGFADHINVLLTLDTESYEGSDHPGHHPIAWYHEFDGGRAFYTGLGHTHESYAEDLFLDHLWGGIIYAMGE